MQQGNKQVPIAIVWSPHTAMLPFNPVLTPQRAMPLTPFVATPLPYFTFSPIMAVAAYSPQIQQFQQQPQQQPQQQQLASQHKGYTPLHVSPILATATPMLQPPPGSNAKVRPRKRKNPFTVINSAKALIQIVPSPIASSTPMSKVLRTESPSELMAVKNLLHEAEKRVPRKDNITSISSAVSTRPNEHLKNNFTALQQGNRDTYLNRGPSMTSQLQGLMISPDKDSHEKPFSSSDCEQTVAVKLPMDEIKLPSPESSESEPERCASPTFTSDGFQCPQCSKVFKFKKHCRRHMVNHSGQKPYKCSKCATKFARKDICQRHTANCKNRS